MEPFGLISYRFVRETAQQNWLAYEDKDGQPEGHLLSYPVDVIVSIQESVPVVSLVARTKVRIPLGFKQNIHFKTKIRIIDKGENST